MQSGLKEEDLDASEDKEVQKMITTRAHESIMSINGPKGKMTIDLQKMIHYDPIESQEVS
ncbi:MAG: hypothetical protein ABIC95_04315 [archaeon]